MARYVPVSVNLRRRSAFYASAMGYEQHRPMCRSSTNVVCGGQSEVGLVDRLRCRHGGDRSIFNLSKLDNRHARISHATRTASSFHFSA
jgi:hypothetical protein